MLCTMIWTIISMAMVTPAFLVFTLILAHHSTYNMRGSNFRLRGSCLPKKAGRDWEKTTTRLCFNPGGNPLTRKHCCSSPAAVSVLIVFWLREVSKIIQFSHMCAIYPVHCLNGPPTSHHISMIWENNLFSYIITTNIAVAQKYNNRKVE